MDKVNIYAVTTCKGPSVQEAAGAYVIEKITDGIPTTKQGYLYRKETTGVELTIQLLSNAVYILSKLDIKFETLMISTEEKIVESAFTQKWIDKWIKEDWKNSKGSPVAHKEDWQVLVNLLEGLSQRYIFTNKNTSFFPIMHMWSDKELHDHRLHEEIQGICKSKSDKLDSEGEK